MMTEREWLLRLCRRLRAENRTLQAANANLRVERDAADVLLGKAMDELLRRNEQRGGRP